MCSAYINVETFLRLLHRLRDGDKCRGVENNVHAAHSLPDARNVSKVGFDDLDILRNRRDVFSFACGEIIQHAHRIAAREQSLCDVRTDEPHSASDESFHHRPVRLSMVPMVRRMICKSIVSERCLM